MKAGGWTIRQATVADEGRLRRLMQESERITLRQRGRDLAEYLTSSPFFLAEQEATVRGFLACSSRRHPHAALIAAGLDDQCSVSQWLDRILPPCIAHLRITRFTTLSYVGSAEWLAESLLGWGFRLLDHVVTYETAGLSIPHAGNPAVDVRPAQPADLSALVDLDALNFHPIWRNTRETFRNWRRAVPYFAVATMGDTVVGYCTCHLVGPGHGHLVRVAVHPAWQGLGIGTRLLAEAGRFFEQAGAHRITLNTQEGNARAKWLYRQFGFQPSGHDTVAVWREV